MSFYNGILNHDDIHGSGQIGPRGLPGLKGDKGDNGDGYILTSDGNYDIQNKNLVNVKNGVNGSDAVTKSQLDTKTSLLQGARPGYVVNDKAAIYSGTGALHAQSLYLKDTPDGSGNSDEIRIITEYQSYENVHLYIPNLKNYDGYGNRRRSELMVTSVDQTVTGKKTFQNIEVPTPTGNNNPTTKKYVDDLSNTKLDKIFTTNVNRNNKQLTNLGYDISNPGDVVNLGFTDQKYLQKVSDSDLDMDEHRIKNSLEPVNSRDLTTKNYVDNQMGTKADLSKTTTQTFQGRVQIPDFNSGGHNGSEIVNLRYIDGAFLNKKAGGTLNNPITFLSSLQSNQRQIHNLGVPQFNSSAANKRYVDEEIGKIAIVDTTQFIKRDGTVAMIANLDMGTQKIENVKTPTNDMDVATKGYIDDTLSKSHLVSSHKTNAFKYLDNPNDTSSEYNITVEAFTDFNESPHRNKKAFQITLQKDAGTNNYRSRMGFNLYPLPLGTYTIIFEYFFPEDSGIQLSCQATTAYVHKQVQKDFTDYSKLLVQINNNSKITPDYIFFTIHGTATVSNPEGYIIVYGVKDWTDSVDPSIYDSDFYTQIFEYRDGGMYMNTSIDLNHNHKIINIPQPKNPTDLLMKMSVSIFHIPLYGMIDRNNDFTNNSVPIGFDSIFLSKITLINKNKFQGSSDKIIISFKNNLGNINRLNYPFTFSGSGSQITVVIINNHFIGEIIRITTQHANQIPFVLTYQSVYI